MGHFFSGAGLYFILEEVQRAHETDFRPKEVILDGPRAAVPK